MDETKKGTMSSSFDLDDRLVRFDDQISSDRLPVGCDSLMHL